MLLREASSLAHTHHFQPVQFRLFRSAADSPAMSSKKNTTNRDSRIRCTAYSHQHHRDVFDPYPSAHALSAENRNLARQRKLRPRAPSRPQPGLDDVRDVVLEVFAAVRRSLASAKDSVKHAGRSIKDRAVSRSHRMIHWATDGGRYSLQGQMAKAGFLLCLWHRPGQVLKACAFLTLLNLLF